eukprot:RCo025298
MKLSAGALALLGSSPRPPPRLCRAHASSLAGQSLSRAPPGLWPPCAPCGRHDHRPSSSSAVSPWPCVAVPRARLYASSSTTATFGGVSTSSASVAATVAAPAATTWSAASLPLACPYSTSTTTPPSASTAAPPGGTPAASKEAPPPSAGAGDDEEEGSVAPEGGGSGSSADTTVPTLMISELEQISEFDRHQLNRLYQHFSHLAGAKGSLTQADFATNFQLMGTVDAQICAKYFDLFDRNNNGVINFEEFVLGLSQLFKVVKHDKNIPHQIVKDDRDARLIWSDPGPETVLLVKKWKDQYITDKVREMGRWLKQHGLRVFVEELAYRTEYKSDFEPFDPETKMDNIDFMICVGGDGTLLHMASLVENVRVIPPVMPFAMGSLGFLTPFEIHEYEHVLTRVLQARAKRPLYCSLRSRLKCEVWLGSRLHTVRRVLNECLIDRGASPFLSKLIVLIDGQRVTVVQADGLIIATPSGSTAYNTAAGGAMVVPSVNCTLLTPIAPHSLSFRPIIIPDTSTIDVLVPDNARAPARASFDGRHEVDLPRGSRVRIQTSRRPFPLINLHRYDTDWYNSIKTKLSWNVRVEQGSNEE